MDYSSQPDSPGKQSAVATIDSTVYIASDSSVPFSDRVEAGRMLARELERLKIPADVVLGIPRGGMVVAREVARILDAGLDIVLSRKIGAPANPEFAVAAVSEDGHLSVNERAAAQVGASPEYLFAEKQRQLELTRSRSNTYRSLRRRLGLTGKRVVIVDDGIATGTTMRAALWTARNEGALRLTAAVPVGPEESVREMASDADEVVCLRVPPFFSAVGQFYMRFDQTDDEEVAAILQEEAERGS